MRLQKQVDRMENVGCSVPAVLKKLIPALQDFADKCDANVCRIHDAQYDAGGSEALRVVADFALFLGARKACGDMVAIIVFNAVRNLGVNHWGTGKPWHGGESAWPPTPEAP